MFLTLDLVSTAQSVFSEDKQIVIFQDKMSGLQLVASVSNDELFYTCEFRVTPGEN